MPQFESNIFPLLTNLSQIENRDSLLAQYKERFRLNTKMYKIFYHSVQFVVILLERSEQDELLSIQKIHLQRLVNELIELFGGKVWVESKAGNGSTFYFTIPIYPNEKQVSESFIS